AHLDLRGQRARFPGGSGARRGLGSVRAGRRGAGRYRRPSARLGGGGRATVTSRSRALSWPRRGTALDVRRTPAPRRRSARRPRDEGPGAGGTQPPRLERGRERIGRALEERGMIARGDQYRDARVAQDIERRACLSRRSTAVSSTNSVNNVLGKRPVIGNGR